MVGLLLSFYFTNQLWAGSVRTIYIDSTTMAPINLRLGKSTVLRFPEKPKKVILGNSNYYTVEFIDNDVALQPQGTVPTNLFVYGAKSVYGFLIQSSIQGGYDDLVQVKWKEFQSEEIRIDRVPVSPIQIVSQPQLSFKLGKNLNIAILKIQKFENKDFYIVDLGFQNPGLNTISLEGLEVVASNQKVKISPQEFFLRSKTIPSGKVTFGRLLLKTQKKKGFTISVRLKNITVKQIISSQFL